MMKPLRKRNKLKQKMPLVFTQREHDEALARMVRGKLGRPVTISRTEGILKGQLFKSNIRFFAQAQIGPYRMDFLLPSKMVLEVEGMVHDTRGEEERRRTDYLESRGFLVIRVTPSHVNDGDIPMIIRNIYDKRSKELK